MQLVFDDGTTQRLWADTDVGTLEWAGLVARRCGLPVRSDGAQGKSTKALSDVVEQTGEEGDVDAADVLKARLLMRALIEEARVCQASYQGSTAIHAGFLYKRSLSLFSTWNRRYFVLHSSGVLKYYEDVWVPGKPQNTERTLITPSCLFVDYADEAVEAVSSANAWPRNVP